MAEKTRLQVVATRKITITSAELYRLLKGILPTGAKIEMPKGQANIEVEFTDGVSSLEI